MSVILEQAGFGGDAAAPAARRLFDYLLAGEPVPERQPFSEPEPIVLPPELDDDGNLINEFGQRVDALGNVLTPEQIAALEKAAAQTSTADSVVQDSVEQPTTSP
jgi:hypothetical protein